MTVGAMGLWAACTDGDAWPQPVATASPAPATSDVISTEIITYDPHPPPAGGTEDGECTSAALTVNGRDDAWRCTTRGMIYDPCFETDDGLIACGMNPVVGDAGVAVQLTAPLPDRPIEEDGPQRYWMVELEGGAVCVSAAAHAVADEPPPTPDGAAPAVSYWCSDGGVILGDLDGAEVLRAHVVPRGEALPETEGDLEGVSLVAVKRAWR